MTLQEFVEKYLGKKIDWDGYYGGQCVDLYRQYVDDVLEYPQPRGVAGAKDFWSNYDSDPSLYGYYLRIPNTPDGVPEAGDVMLWNGRAGGGYGHVAIFLEGDVNTFVSFDQNWPRLDECTKTEHSYTNLYGWLRPVNLDEVEAKLREQIKNLKKEIEDLKDSFARAKELCESMELQNNELLKKLADATQKAVDWENRYVNLNESYQKIVADRDKLDQIIKDQEFSVIQSLIFLFSAIEKKINKKLGGGSSE